MHETNSAGISVAAATRFDEDRRDLGRVFAEHDLAGVVVTDQDRTIITVNRAFAGMLGYGPEELEGTAIGDVMLEERSGGADLFDGHRPAATVETALRHRKGHPVQVLLSVSPLAGSSNQDPATVGVAVGLAGRRLEEQQTRAQRLAIQSAVAGGAAQDFAELLATVLDNADMALLDLDDQRALLGRLQRIREAAQNAAELSQQMLAYSGRGRYVVWEADLNTLLREMEYTLRSATPRAIEIRFDLDPSPPSIRADCRQLKQVVMNLVANASEAIGGGSGTIRLATGRRLLGRDELAEAAAADELPPGSYVFLEIADDGCGIPPEDAQRVFEPFFTTKRSSHGLGLPAALGVLRALQGTITLHSQPGFGSRFTLLFPATEVSSDPPPSSGS